MTITDLPRPTGDLQRTPESHDLAKLFAMLEEPALIGFRTEILDAIEQITGVRPGVES